MENNQVTKEQLEEHWAKTKSLMIFCMVVWVLSSFFIHFFVLSLNNVKFLNFPLGFYMAAQGSLIIFVILIFYYAKKQNAIDKEYKIAEADDDYGDEA